MIAITIIAIYTNDCHLVRYVLYYFLVPVLHDVCVGGVAPP